ncbi:C-C motif chemokine 5-like [Phalacrocorax carbo]|uniref:C-C motif chemokine 5-like n=1 Tax=Phalacrocorax carbo TaxID=9209 RepID=UPI003119FF85
MLTARTVLLLVLLLTFSLHHTAAHSSPTECCYKHAQRRIQHIQSFYETPKDCSLPAVVFVTLRGVKICTNPKKPWVKQAIERLQRKK